MAEGAWTSKASTVWNFEYCPLRAGSICPRLVLMSFPFCLEAERAIASGE